MLEQITKLENKIPINQEEIDSKRKELNDIRQKKMEGIKIISRVKWITEGEKVTKYFCNLENRNFISKSMNSIRKNNGNIIRQFVNFKGNYAIL